MSELYNGEQKLTTDATITLKSNLNATPEQIAEADALIDSLPDQEKPSTQDLRAAFFEKHRNQLMLGLKHIKLKALKRCVAAVALGELSTKEYKPQTELEKNFVHHFDECVKMRAEMVFEESMERLMKAWQKEQEDLEKDQALTNQLLSEDAKKMLEENNVDVNEVTTKGVL